MKRTSERVGGLLIVTTAGVMTLADAEKAMMFVAAELRAQDARAVVVDLRLTVAVISTPQWRETLDPSLAGALSRVPLCYVVSPACLAQAEERCWALAERGMIRSAFTALPCALAWASRRREHWPAAPLPASRSVASS